MQMDDFQALVLQKLNRLEDTVSSIKEELVSLQDRVNKMENRNFAQSDDQNDKEAALEAIRISRLENKLKRMQSHIMRTKKPL